MTPEKLLDILREAGVDSAGGVPCSLLEPLLRVLRSDPGLNYLPLTNEGDAVAWACGHWLAGGSPLVLLQNSGLGNAVNPLTSLAQVFEIPLALAVSWRGRPGMEDAPQHQLMGAITPHLLELMRIPCRVLLRPDDRFQAPDLGPASVCWLGEAAAKDRHPRALVLPKGVLDASPEAAGDPGPIYAPVPSSRAPGADRAGTREDPPGAGEELPTRTRALEVLVERFGVEVPVVATTGKTGRELFALRDSPNHFYMVGSMGCAPSLGLGVARKWGGRGPVVVLDGDGAALMRLGAQAAVGALAPPDLVHVLLDNGRYDSTGGQPTLAPGVDFPGVARALGYPAARTCRGPEQLVGALSDWVPGQGPTLLHVPVLPGSPASLPRPPEAPSWYARRFRDFLS